MKRRLIRQILNEWPANIWLAIELLLVSAVMWWLTDQLWTTWATYHEPLGYDISHCYKVTLHQLNENSPEYTKTDGEHMCNDRVALLDRLKARPEIEAVASSVNSYFYNPSNSFRSVDIDTLHEFCLIRSVTPDFFRVFRIYGAAGETPEQMAQFLENTPYNALLAENDLYKVKYGIESMDKYVGRSFHYGSDSNEVVLLKIIPPLRYSEFHTSYDRPTILEPMFPGNIPWANEVTVRVKDNMDKDFVANLMKDASTSLRVGNWYIQSVDPFDGVNGIRDLFLRGRMQEVRTTVIWSVFLLANIFLGILGTFWFRTSQRTKEIALRMANGATRADIFRRVITEGEIILIAVTPVSMAICYMLTQYDLNTSYMGVFFEPVRFIGCTLITFALVSLMIVLGSWLPARKAMSISPAEALKTE